MNTDCEVSLQAGVETIIDNLPSAVIVLNHSMQILIANRMAENMANSTKENLCGIRGGNALHCAHSIDVREGCGFGPACKKCLMRSTVEDSFRTHSDHSMVETSMEFLTLGKRFLCLSTTYLLDGDIVILAIEDITQIKEVEARNIENGKLLAAINTAGAVCHEMNQPLQVISGYVDILMMNRELSDSCFQYLQRIKDQINRLGDITKALHHLNTFQTKEYIKGTDILDLTGSTNFVKIAGGDKYYEKAHSVRG